MLRCEVALKSRFVICLKSNSVGAAPSFVNRQVSIAGASFRSADCMQLEGFSLLDLYTGLSEVSEDIMSQ